MPSHIALSAYTIMWIYVFFDLPTDTKRQRGIATRFRKELLRDGFTMMQFSVYIRHCGSNESAIVHIQRIREIVPEEGLVSIIKITDKQFGETINLVGKKAKQPVQPYTQLEFF